MKTLYLIRHAKSSWDEIGLSDFERPLNSRGKKDVLVMGQRLKEAGILPQIIISSSANRAFTTAQSLAAQIDFNLDSIEIEPRIYEASAKTLSSIINHIDDSKNIAFLIGHNPGFTYLAEDLTGEHFGNIPTCGIVGIEFPIESWQYVSNNSGTCISYDYPKKIS
ncbi:MAG: histidine phosphatase family protein [Flavobacteriales bacterium]|nr:histidine phosphatase family protein [Flavobacteriales bacterium]